MLILISPAKKLDFENTASIDNYTNPLFLDDTQYLINVLRKKSVSDVAKLMKLSDKLAKLNVARYASFNLPFSLQNAKQAIFAFKGDVYATMQASTFTNEQINFAQTHLAILSGLYGLLRPLDLMQPYRLEMGTRLATESGKNLYEFWDVRITQAINEALTKTESRILINLASDEYFKSVKKDHLDADIITPQFKDLKDGQYKVVGILAKRARGLMSRYIIENEITNEHDIKKFDWQGYQYRDDLSTEKEWVFTRDTA